MRRTWLVYAFLLSGCASDERPSAEAPKHEKRLALCSQHAARNGHSLSPSTPLCEHQILTEPLTTERSIEVPFRLISEERIRYCFVDDNGEPHTATLSRDGRPWVSVQHGGGCQEVTLPSGDYSLEIRHASLGGADSTPDIVHTRWKEAADGAPASLTLTTNQCPGCDLSGLEFPRLGGTGGVLGFGYAGNYEKANFSRGFCKISGVEGCAIGYQNVVSNFDGASFDDLRVKSRPVFFGTLAAQGTYRGTTFHNLPLEGVPFMAAGDFTNADFTGASLGQLQVTGAAIFKNVKLANASVGFSSDAYPFSNATLDGPTFRALREMNVVVRFSRIEVDRGTDLAKLEIDGARNNWVWPRNPTGEIALADTSFLESTISNVTFPCDGGGSLARADFTQARLAQVGFAECDLTQSRWQNGAFAGLSLARARLDGATFSGSTLDGIDLTGASLLDVELTTGGATPAARGLVISGARVLRRASSEGLDLVELVATNADLSKSNFDGVVFNGASMSGARLDDASFKNALFVGAMMESAVGKRVTFDGARFSGGSLAGAQWTATTLDATTFDTTRLVGARFCGGSARGTSFATANLNLALLPAVSVSVLAPEGTIECTRIEGMNPYSLVLTSVATTCPDGGMGKCDTSPRWVPALPYPVCCKPFDDPTCIRKVAGAACTSACDCASLKCNAVSKVCE